MFPPWQDTIAMMAREDPKLRFTTLVHRLTPHTLKLAFKRLNRNAAPGPDGLTVPQYGSTLDERLHDLWQRLRSKRYRASPARQRMIPKPNGKLRPLGIANVEDRIVQTAVTMLLEPIYEQDFLDVSYGFRPGRSPKGALEELRRTIDRRPIRVVYEADIKGFFDNLDHGWLRKFLAHRVADGGVERLIGKVLKSGVVDEDGRIHRGKKGAPQGGPLSPLLANIYLHYVLDLWFMKRYARSCRGEAYMVRYADDFVMCFEHAEDAERFGPALEERLAAFELELEPDKTRKIEFGTETESGKPGPNSGGHTFEFLGFTHYMRRRPKRGLKTARKPSAKSRRRFIASMKSWLQKYMHKSVWFHQKALSAKLRGFFQYFKLRHCRPSLDSIRNLLFRVWARTLRRRSQRGRRLWWYVLWRKPWFKLPRVSSAQKEGEGSNANADPEGPAQSVWKPKPNNVNTHLGSRMRKSARPVLRGAGGSNPPGYPPRREPLSNGCWALVLAPGPSAKPPQPPGPHPSPPIPRSPARAGRCEERSLRRTKRRREAARGAGS